MNIDRARARVRSARIARVTDIYITIDIYSRLLDLLEAARTLVATWNRQLDPVRSDRATALLAAVHALDDPPPWTPTVSTDGKPNARIALGRGVRVTVLCIDGDWCFSRDEHGSRHMVLTANLRPLEADHA